MMVGSLWSDCIWFVYVAFACATAGWSSLQRVSMGLMFSDLCCWWCLYWWCLSVGLQSVYVMMVGSLWSACIWFVYIGFACAGVTNGWMIVAAGCKYGIDVYWYALLMVFILMVFECWLAECMCHDGWLALIELYLICVCGFRMCWRDERLHDRRCRL